MGTGLQLGGTSALVTGGGSGIGLAVAKRLAADGASVTICGRTKRRLDDAVAEIEAVAAAGSTVRAAQADVTDEADVAQAVDAAVALTGRLDALVAVAGGSSGISPLTQFDLALWRDTTGVNVTGTMLAIKYAARPPTDSGRAASASTACDRG